ncbi:hypothetical protein BCON_0019g00290 [Botryotinia convoluta]|uniref:PLL-like beta propeller domain-containing protein n=1 Tax=Botryotinia convoluta TaxID=54673 RepID=A0A4Z1J013_9HELO|nr:hypothetical protein BCON_0019g00290 [Botryotinia convoluta]
MLPYSRINDIVTRKTFKEVTKGLWVEAFSGNSCEFHLVQAQCFRSSLWSSWVSTGRKSASSPVVTHYGAADANTFAVLIVSLEHIPYGGISTSEKSDSLAALDRSYDQSMSIVGVELTTGELLHTWSVVGAWANAWETWTGVGYCLSKPTIVSCKESCIDVFVFAADRGLRQLTHRLKTGWGTWQNLSGSYVYDPISISASPSRIDVFEIDFDGYIYRSIATLTGNEVGSFTRTCIGAPSTSFEKVEVTSPGVFSVTTRKSKGVYQQIFYESTTGVWTPQGGMTEVVQSAWRSHKEYHDGIRSSEMTLVTEAYNAVICFREVSPLFNTFSSS